MHVFRAAPSNSEVICFTALVIYVSLDTILLQFTQMFISALVYIKGDKLSSKGSKSHIFKLKLDPLLMWAHLQ